MILCLKIIDFVNEVLKICERGVGGVRLAL